MDDYKRSTVYVILGALPIAAGIYYVLLKLSGTGALFYSFMSTGLKRYEDYEPHGETLSSRVLEPDAGLDNNSGGFTLMDVISKYCVDYSYVTSVCLTTFILLILYFVLTKIAEYVRIRTRVSRENKMFHLDAESLTMNNIALKKALQNRNNERQALKRRLKWYIQYYKHTKVCRKENHEMCQDFKDEKSIDDVRSVLELKAKIHMETEMIRKDRKIESFWAFLEHQQHRLSSCVQQFDAFVESRADSGLDSLRQRTFEKCVGDIKAILDDINEFARMEQEVRPQEPKEHSDCEDDESFYSLATTP